jgi:ribosomal protein S18 acetylase RimI-like enzyme
VASVVIRAAGPRDRDALYEICRLTGDAGEDASDLYADPDLLGELWVGPYLVLEPSLAFVAVDERGPAGYVLGAADTVAFEAACEEAWWPQRRERYPEPPATGDLSAEERLHRWVHHPPATPPEVVAEYPAHLHIDLHPRAQGQGLGRRLIDTLFGALRARHVTGVHLGVAAANSRAIGFYTHLGFQPLGPDGSGGLLYGRRLTPAEHEGRRRGG